jgi:hypothetical protein
MFIKKTIYRYELIIDFLDKRSTSVAIDNLKKYLAKICKHIKPRKAKIQIDIGFDNPATTGQALACLGPLYGLIGNTLIVRPNFEEKILIIDFELKGRMTALKLGIIAIRVVKDKAIKRFIKNIDKLKEDLANGGQ